MKKIGVFTLILIMTATLMGCGRRANEVPTEAPTTTKAPIVTEPTVIPDIPPMETNIPDPTVNSNSTEPLTEDPTTATHATRKHPAPRSNHRGN